MPTAAGSFDVTPTPEPPVSAEDGVTLGRMRFDKVFRGPLAATSVVHMTYVAPPAEASAAYVAIERIEGTLDGRAGSFVVLHVGGPEGLALTIARDTGTGDLAGISGSMTLQNDEGAHTYSVTYEL